MGKVMDTVAVNLTPDSLEYMQSLLDMGAVSGSSTSGTLRINPTIRELVNGLYQVLAGGGAKGVTSIIDIPNSKMTITIDGLGDPTKYNDLQTMEATCTAAINTTNSTFSQNYKLVVEF
jgi:hypothetical protein